MASAASRLASVEAALSPTQLVVRWLDEAHGYGSLDAYVGSRLDGPAEDFPLTRLLREAKATTRRGPAASRKSDPDDVVRRALLETAFRFELVLRINVTTHELLDREELRHWALAGYLALLANASPTERNEAAHADWLATCLRATDACVTELLASAEARSTVETRYLAGHLALFADEQARFAEQLDATQRQTVMAMQLAELDGVEAGKPGHPDAVAERAPVLVENLVQPAKVTALEKLGDGRQALSIATRWLRAKAQPTADSA